jgi:hypothetical protein
MLHSGKDSVKPTSNPWSLITWSLMTALSFVLGLGERKTALQSSGENNSANEQAADEEEGAAADENENEKEEKTETSATPLSEFHSTPSSPPVIAQQKAQSQREIASDVLLRDDNHQNRQLSLSSLSNAKHISSTSTLKANHRSENLANLTDEEILEQIENGELTFYNLEQQLNDSNRAVAIRRRLLGNHSYSYNIVVREQ